MNWAKATKEMQNPAGDWLLGNSMSLGVRALTSTGLLKKDWLLV